MSTSSEKANLARIRDNQRRSRARRKEYLAELESKLRQCELQGIEASAEIQQAARKVADENKRLRVLLAQQGIPDDNVDAFLHSSGSANAGLDYGYSNLNATSGAVEALERLLITKRECCISASRNMSGSERSRVDPPSPSSSHDRQDGSSSRGSSVVASQQSSSWDANQHSILLRQQQQQQQRGQVIPTNRPRYNIDPNLNSTNSHTRHSISTPVQTQNQDLLSASQHQNNLYGYDMRYASPIPSPNSSRSSYTVSPQTQHISPSTSTNVNSCLYAADMITTMAGGDPRAVRAELGCMSSMDCEVDNQLVFNVLDRYHVGL